MCLVHCFQTYDTQSHISPQVELTYYYSSSLLYYCSSEAEELVEKVLCLVAPNKCWTCWSIHENSCSWILQHGHYLQNSASIQPITRQSGSRALIKVVSVPGKNRKRRVPWLEKERRNQLRGHVWSIFTSVFWFFFASVLLSSKPPNIPRAQRAAHSMRTPSSRRTELNWLSSGVVFTMRSCKIRDLISISRPRVPHFVADAICPDYALKMRSHLRLRALSKDPLSLNQYTKKSSGYGAHGRNFPDFFWSIAVQKKQNDILNTKFGFKWKRISNIIFHHYSLPKFRIIEPWRARSRLYRSRRCN